jgi:hypothetical protein
MTLMARKRDFGVDGALHKKSKMPRPCAVETRVGRYTDGLSDKDWHLETLFLILLAANMKFHGTSPWYLFDFLCKAKPRTWIRICGRAPLPSINDQRVAVFSQRSYHLPFSWKSAHSQSLLSQD